MLKSLAFGKDRDFRWRKGWLEGTQTKGPEAERRGSRNSKAS